MHRTVGNPVFLGEGARSVDNELLGLLVIGGGGLHLGGIVAVTQFGEAETPGDLQLVQLLEDPFMAFGVQGVDGSPEKVIVHGKLSASGQSSRGSEDVGRVIAEV